MQAAIDLIQNSPDAASMLRPVRLRILEELREPDSAAEVARRLGLPRQRVSYHVKELEKRGFVQYLGERKRGNCVERLLQASARHYVIAPQALGGVGGEPADVQDRFSSTYLVATAAQTLRDVAALQERARKQKRKLATLSLEAEVRFGSPAAQHAFAEELANVLALLVARYNDFEAESGRTFRFVLSGYPAPGAADATSAETDTT
jgi:DNA-binding transcriptional ArsR family regulator